MRGILIALAVVCAYLAGGSIAHPFIDGDLFWQRQLGESILATGQIPRALGSDAFTAVGAPWLPHEWLFSILVALAFRLKMLWVLAALTGAVYFAMLSITAVRAKRLGASFNGAVLALVLGLICLEPSFVLRSQVWVWPLFALLLLVLDFDDVRIWWSIPIVVVWANLHASAILAIPIVWLDAMVRFRESNRQRWFLCGAVVLAAMCTPFGWNLLKYSVESHPSFQYIYEWFPITSLNFTIVAGFIPLIGLSAYAAWKLWRQRARDVVLVFGLAVYAILHQRNLGLFAIGSMPLAALALGQKVQWKKSLESARGLVIAAAAIVVLIPLGGWFGYSVSQSQPPIFVPPQASVAALRQIPGEHRILCTTYSWCSVFLGNPDNSVFLDGKADPYPSDVWQSFLTVIRVQPGWQPALDRYRVNAILARRDGLLAPELKRLPEWKQIPDSDACCILFVR